MAVGIVRKVVKAVVDAMNAVTGIIRDVTGAIRTLRRLPGEIASAFNTALNNMRDATNDFRREVVKVGNLFVNGSSDPSPQSPSTGSLAKFAELDGLATESEDLYQEALSLYRSYDIEQFSMTDTIKPDDNLAAIANRMGTSVDVLIDVNSLRAPYIIAGRKRPFEENGDYGVLYPGDPIKVPGNNSSLIAADDDRTVTISERIFRSDFQLDDEGNWVVDSGAPVLISGPLRIQNRVDNFEFKCTLGSSVIDPTLGTEIDAMVGSWSDVATIQRVGAMAYRQTLAKNPYIRFVQRVSIRRTNPGIIEADAIARLIDGTRQVFNTVAA